MIVQAWAVCWWPFRRLAEKVGMGPHRDEVLNSEQSVHECDATKAQSLDEPPGPKLHICFANCLLLVAYLPIKSKGIIIA